MGSCNVVLTKTDKWVAECWCKVGYSGTHCEITDGNNYHFNASAFDNLILTN